MAKKVKKLKLNFMEPDNTFLYPILDDTNFNIKIAEKQEFFDTKYDGKIKSVKTSKDCDKKFELTPHQYFVKNFLSFNTPYNSLLLYHGLGTGKTCSAIGICEEMREYMKQMNINKRIIIVASPNVQNEFKLQLFDDRKLEKNGSIWNIESCVGNSLINEIDPMNIKQISKIQLIRRVHRLINEYYLFMGYIEFSNYISNKIKIQNQSLSHSDKEKILTKKLNSIFSNRLIVIDEAHNIRMSDSNTKHNSKKITNNLMQLVARVKGLRLLLLSATPMYNSYSEIIWLLNLMNRNDNRSTINIKEVFDNSGNFVIDDNGVEVGKNLLIQKSRGYISFVRGENPYLFPYRIYPSMFSNNSLKNITKYPTNTLNNKVIVQPIQYLDIYLTQIGEYQNNVYNKIITNLKDANNIEEMNAFGYTILNKPLEALNIVFPDNEDDIDKMIGKNGLRNIMNYQETKERRYNYEYNEETLSNFGEIFNISNINKYSGKIAAICSNFQDSEGIVLIYSQYIEGGLIPMALVLESLGYGLYNSRYNILKNNKRTKKEKYIIISGDKLYSDNNNENIKAATDDKNKDGSVIKFILISKAGSEGVDFKFVRQIHILEPWYNMNRIEQIIGRGVRTCSHKLLPLSKRNVQIFMYGSILHSETEAVDLYVYRLAELKSIKIGNISRLLKQTAVDCILNKGQMNFNEENMKQTINIILGNKQTIEYKVGDKPYSSFCDYKDECQYSCIPDKNNLNINQDSYDERFLIMKRDKIINLIREIYKEYYVLDKRRLISIIMAHHKYSIGEIYSALTELLENNNIYITDKYNRLGNLINIGDYYLYQPIELKNKNISMYDRTHPVNYKKKKLIISDIKELRQKTDTHIILLKEMLDNYTLSTIDNSVKRGEKNFYKFCKSAITQLHELLDIDIDILSKFVIDHQIEVLSYDDKLLLLNYLYFNTLSEYETKLKEYFDDKIIELDNIKALFIINNNSYHLIKLDKTKWINALETDIRKLQDKIKEYTTFSSYNNIIGFMFPFRNKINVFKIRDFTTKRSKGARCDQAAKNSPLGVINVLNKLQDRYVFTNENTKTIYTIELCMYAEFIFRYYQYTNYLNKTWFLTPELSVLLNIEKLN